MYLCYENTHVHSATPKHYKSVHDPVPSLIARSIGELCLHRARAPFPDSINVIHSRRVNVNPGLTEYDTQFRSYRWLKNIH